MLYMPSLSPYLFFLYHWIYAHGSPLPYRNIPGGCSLGVVPGQELDREHNETPSYTDNYGSGSVRDMYIIVRTPAALEY
jgi:hypothetical protein